MFSPHLEKLPNYHTVVKSTSYLWTFSFLIHCIVMTIRLLKPTLFSIIWVEVILYLLASFPFSMLCIVSLILVKKGFAMLNKSCVEAEQEVFCHVIFQKELFGSSFICSCINVLRGKNSSQYSHTWTNEQYFLLFVHLVLVVHSMKKE